MTLLLSIFIVYMLVRMTQISGILQRINWFERYYHWSMSRIEKWVKHFEIRQMIIVFVPLLLLIWVFQGILPHHVIYFILSIVVLLYGWSYQEKETIIPSSPRDYTRFVFSRALSSGFTVVFWFVLLGPWGVLLYDCIRRANMISAKQILEWPAARILGLGYALAGHFPPAFSYWSLNIFKPIQHNQTFLEECGLYALNAGVTDADTAESKESEEAKTLIKRAEIMLLIILIILVMGGLLY